MYKNWNDWKYDNINKFNKHMFRQGNWGKKSYYIYNQIIPIGNEVSALPFSYDTELWNWIMVM